MKLVTRISLSIWGMLALTLLSSAIVLLSVYRIGNLMRKMVTDNLASVRAAEELEIALLEQRGFVSSYILDEGRHAWLDELVVKRENFAHWLSRARETAHTSEEYELVAKIAEVSEQYNSKRDEAVTLFDSGQAERAKSILLIEVQTLYNTAYKLCEDFIVANENYIEMKIAEGHGQFRNAIVTVGISIGLTIVLGIGLLWLFIGGVILPLRQMAKDAGSHTVNPAQSSARATPGDELRAVGMHLNTLMSDMSETRMHLEKSKLQLMNAEKLASVGRLAASVAHEIRNPLTSLQMRLFSLQEAIGDNVKYQEDLNVLSEEIAHMERIIQNFLEFSRPPVLKLHPQDICLLIDKTLELAGHWLTERHIVLTWIKERGLPSAMADSEQMKQVLINLIRNAVEATGQGGKIHIQADAAWGGDKRRMLVVLIRDNGPGIPPDARKRIFEPFFSTKQDGTGLGLSIAASIMASHNGRLELESSSPNGTTFAVWIPAVGEED